MLKPLLIAFGVAALAATQASAQTQCALTYPIFEGAIPHLDLEKCPADLNRAGAFCRATAATRACLCLRGKGQAVPTRRQELQRVRNFREVTRRITQAQDAGPRRAPRRAARSSTCVRRRPA